MKYFCICLMIIACWSHKARANYECVIFETLYAEYNTVVFRFDQKFCEKTAKINFTSNEVFKTQDNIIRIKLKGKGPFNFTATYIFSDQTTYTQNLRGSSEEGRLYVSKEGYWSEKQDLPLHPTANYQRCLLKSWTAKHLDNQTKLSFKSNCSELYLRRGKLYEKIKGSNGIMSGDSDVYIYQKIRNEYVNFEVFASVRTRSEGENKKLICLLRTLECKEVQTTSCLISSKQLYLANNISVVRFVQGKCGKIVSLETSSNSNTKTKGNLLWMKLNKKEDYKFLTTIKSANNKTSTYKFNASYWSDLMDTFRNVGGGRPANTANLNKKGCIIRSWNAERSKNDIKLSLTSNCSKLYIYRNQKYEKIKGNTIILNSSDVLIFRKIKKTYVTFEAFANPEIESSGLSKPWLCRLSTLECKCIEQEYQLNLKSPQI